VALIGEPYSWARASSQERSSRLRLAAAPFSPTPATTSSEAQALAVGAVLAVVSISVVPSATVLGFIAGYLLS
jgi:hypothetical protein